MNLVKFSTALLLAALSFSALAVPLNDEDIQRCQAMGRTAELVMSQRQEEDDMAMSLTIAAGLPDSEGVAPENQYRNVFYALIHDAYTHRRYMTPLARKESVSQFKTKIIQMCLDARLKEAP